MLSNMNPLVALGAGLLVGATTTYLATREVVKKKYEALANEEIESVKAAYSKQETDTKAEKPLTVPFEDLKEVYLQRAADAGYVQPPATEPQVTNDGVEYIEPGQIDFMTPWERSGDWPGSEVNVQKLKRDPALPYLITTDEFLDDLQIEHGKFSLAWYNDLILADDRDEVVEDVEGMIGKQHLECFGQGSDGPDTIYIRNERLKTDFEVSREAMSYVEQMSGISDPDETVWVGSKAPIKKMRPLSD